MAKAKTYEQAQEELASAKATRKECNEAMAEFLKENKLKKGEDYSGHSDEKIAKKWKKLAAAQTEARAAVTAAEEAEKALKPKAERASKYEYPEDVVTADDRKKYRAKMRNAAKAAEAGEKPAKKEKKAKDAEEAPAAEKASKKEKKDKKKDKSED